jgi:hypothetical protein
MFPRRGYASRLRLSLSVWLVAAGNALCADVQVLTQHNDLQRTAANLARNGRHALYVATVANFVYAFDAAPPGSDPLAITDLGNNKVVPSRDAYESAANDEPQISPTASESLAHR